MPTPAPRAFNQPAQQRQTDANNIVSVPNVGEVATVFADVSTATTATAGSATLPVNPVGFIEVNIGGFIRKIAFYEA